MTKATIKDYQVLLDSKNKEIELLKFKLENLERIQRAQCCECERGAVQELSSLHIKNLEIKTEIENCFRQLMEIINDRT